jgi:RING finger protein 113A
LKHHSKNGKCFACGAATQGVFNGARELKTKLAEKKKRMEEREAAIKKKIEAQLTDD